ncbi:unnamed protein product [Lymnaea stagnalis]|uniref:NFX1-type zinc finger-containing protein 1 n=1 Tax=Lymnaea stagnalis TaxID=6523 RepID=A0AAV2IJ96_LYMST
MSDLSSSFDSDSEDEKVQPSFSSRPSNHHDTQSQNEAREKQHKIQSLQRRLEKTSSHGTAQGLNSGEQNLSVSNPFSRSGARPKTQKEPLHGLSNKTEFRQAATSHGDSSWQFEQRHQPVPHHNQESYRQAQDPQRQAPARNVQNGAQGQEEFRANSNFNRPPRDSYRPPGHNGAGHIGYNKLKEWAEIQNSTILLFQMSSDLQGLAKLLNQDKLNFDWVVLLITALKKILGAQSQKGFLHHVLKCVCDSHFLELHLFTFLQDMPRHRCTEMYSIFNNIIVILDYLILNMNSDKGKCNRSLLTIMEIGKRLNVITEGSDLLIKVQRLIGLSDGNSKHNQKSFLHNEPIISRRQRFIPRADEETPPDSYADIAIFPDTDELFSPVEPFLRANKTKGPYRDLQHYLDVHARLMKEDYLSPIRDGLKHFKENFQTGEKISESDLRFYYNVQLTKMSCDADHGITYFVRFDNSGLKNVNWEFSKRLKFGSLLVFSKDCFETTMFATVANRDVKPLEEGIIQVMFQNNLEQVFTSSEHDTFVMAETTAYFESYRHVLEGLQEMQSIPLERYIIGCKREIHPPEYLNDDTIYNLASLQNQNSDYLPVTVLDDIEWPAAYQTQLNDSQLEALQLALTKELAIIQGPPGTGKTYIGLKIMKILLENLEKSGPVLVVCYTNHALDQFLEGMLDFCSEGVVRVGGRSSSKLLERLTLKALRRNPPLIDRKTQNNINKNLGICRKDLKEISQQVERFWQMSLQLETTIVDIEDLKDEITDDHYISLSDSRRVTSSNPHVLRTWLKASNANMENHLAKAAKRHLAKVIARGDEEMSDDKVKDLHSAGKLLFQDRVKIYHYWLNKHKKKLEFETELLLSRDSDDNGKVEMLVHDSERASLDILPDDELMPYMSTNVYMYITQWKDYESKDIEFDNDYIRYWLSMNFKRADEFLDAIDQLSSVKSEGNPQNKQRTNLAGSDIHDFEEPWVIEESDVDETDSEAEDDSDETRSRIDDIDDGGDVHRLNFKILGENYKESKTKEIHLLLRAKMLQIDLTETAEDNEDEEWQTTNNMSYSKVFKLFHKTVPFTEQQVSEITDVWKLPLRDRYKLYKYWVLERKKKLSENLKILSTEYQTVLQRKKEALGYKDIAILEKAKVIGMTTTGAAKYRKVLQAVECRIIIVEEAAEVLEAHIVTTLNPKCQQLILIGDHQQLRPNPTVHKLAIDYNLEISLFERLVKNNLPRVTLTEQHRMRPEISRYVKHIYPHLVDHASVEDLASIKGVDSNVFFLQHSFEESGVDDSTSRSNVHEAKFLVALCKYFLQHGYLGRQITILTAYSGQVACIRNEMEPEESVFEFVRVTSIDNYQGEENDIILLSLVRSNTENKVGFLKTDNRVCVALSRAKRGMFVIGNLNLLASNSKLWTNLLMTARDYRVTGLHMKLICVNHPHHITYVANPEDFQREVPEGGCNKLCETPLSCGHLCTRMCHASDRFHEETKCQQPCLKTCLQGHPCQKDCYEECGDCEVRVTKYMPLCGHDDLVPCSKNVEDVTCSQNCGQTMSCGHTCRGQCGRCMMQAQHQACLERVDVIWPLCKHTVNVECSTDPSVDPCPEKCTERLECTHRCKGTCGGCLSNRVHKPCLEKCKKPLPCGHFCSGPCGGQCVPCGTRCLSSCRHSDCNKTTCGEICDPCTENCALVCQHQQCSLRCMDECPAPPCSKKCGKPVPKCKHKCFSLCGEACVCYKCEKDKFTLIDNNNSKKPQIIVAHEKRERAKKFEVDSETVLMKIPKCGHIFTLTQLDRWMEGYDPKGTDFIKCPVCSAPVQAIARYEKLNKGRLERRENKKSALIKSAMVSSEGIASLKQSKNIVKDGFCSVDGGDFLTRKPEEIDTNHALALSLQFRFAYVLRKIHDIHRDFNEDVDFKIKKWEKVIKSIHRNITDQFHKEMTLELHRLLFLEQISILIKFLQDISLKLPSELKTTCRAILKDNKQKLTSEDKAAFQSIIETLYEMFNGLDQEDYWYIRVIKLKKLSKDVMRVLDEPIDKDLHSILM